MRWHHTRAVLSGEQKQSLVRLPSAKAGGTLQQVPACLVSHPSQHQHQQAEELRRQCRGHAVITLFGACAATLAVWALYVRDAGNENAGEDYDAHYNIVQTMPHMPLLLCQGLARFSRPLRWRSCAPLPWRRHAPCLGATARTLTDSAPRRGTPAARPALATSLGLRIS